MPISGQEEMELAIPSELATKSDPRVLRFALPRSAHSDISIPLIEAARPLKNAVLYCGDPAAFGSVLLHADGNVFAFVEGMLGVTARLSDKTRQACIARGGGDRAHEFGDGWAFLPLYADQGCFLKLLPALVREAYDLV